MELIYRIFKLDKNSREGVIVGTSILNVIINLFISLFKIVVGVISSSIAIISEGVNNATDTLTSLLTIIGSKLASKKADAKHPFGYGRIEYLIGLIIAVLILVSGFEVLKDSITRIFHPEELNISTFSLVILVVSAIIKYLMGVYTINNGKKISSLSLQGLGEECRNDSFVSLVTIAVTLIYLFSGLSLDAYAGVFTSFLIIKAGYELISQTISKILGESVSDELVAKLYSEIRNTKGILNAADMILHNYGPDAYTGSVNVEIDHNKTVGEIYDFLHRLQLKIMYEYSVVMVFGVYAVDKDSKVSKQLHKQISEYVKEHEHIISYHAIYLDKEHDRIYCDLVVDYEVNDHEEVIKDFTEYLKKYYPDKQMVITIDTEFVQNIKM